jgi:Fur family ferric uptake transcriptional regulator
MKREVEKFRALLSSRGLRFTEPRRTVAEMVFSLHTHFTVDGLYERLKRGRRISRATIYRTLALMVKSGLVAEYDFGRGLKYYEHVFGHDVHNHFICTSCGRIEEFGDEDIGRIVERTARKRKFNVKKHTLNVFGICRACSGKKAK